MKFYFRYVATLKKPPAPALHVGKTIHAVLQQWSLARWRGAPLDEAAVAAVLDQEWKELQEDLTIEWEGEEQASKAHALAMVNSYLRETPIPLEEKPEGVEVAVELDLSNRGLPTLIGVLDLVRAGGRIVDFKTTGRSPDSDMVRHTTEVQTTGYALLYREATGEMESAIELHHLVKTKTPKLVVTESPPATERQISRLYHLIDAYVDDVVREDFVPAPGLQCASCEFFNECRAWH
jgi:CRISPR/Cas system-associated exonuclease Cas4 (RecB family)